jgi:hypothetical protein
MNIPIESSIDIDISKKIEKIMGETTFFNVSNVDMVNIYFFYCVNQTIEQFTKVVLPLKVGLLNKDDLLANILKYRIYDGRRFNINGIYSYQFNAEITQFIKDNELVMNEHSQIENIEFKPMVEIFQHYSSIFIILNNEKTTKTKKMYENLNANANMVKPKRKTLKV